MFFFSLEVSEEDCQVGMDVSRKAALQRTGNGGDEVGDQGGRLNTRGNQGSCGYQERWHHTETTAQRGSDKTPATCILEILEDATWSASWEWQVTVTLEVRPQRRGNKGMT